MHRKVVLKWMGTFSRDSVTPVFITTSTSSMPGKGGQNGAGSPFSSRVGGISLGVVK